MSVHSFIVSVREGKYSSLGSYPKYWLTVDGHVLSYTAVRENLGQIARSIRDGGDPEWRVVACDANWEDPELYCDHSGARIESAYAEN